MLFPASPESGPLTREARPVREQAGLKKFASSLSGAFTAKGKGARAKQGFDLSDWNYDLAAIASDPSSSAASASSPPLPSSRRQAAPPPVAVPTVRASYISPNDLVTPTTPHFPSSTNHAATNLTAALELPATTTTETRRRKSDEMEDEDRASFQVPAPPVRREGLHARSHSLAHAHTLRSSRTLSHHASFGDSPRHTPTASTSAHVYATSPGFTNPFPSIKTRATKEAGDHNSYNFGAEPPSKKMSVEGLGSIADRTQDESDEDSAEEEANSVFGYGGTISSTGNKTVRAKSFSRASNSLLVIPPITSSSSHPGWTGDGFGTASPRVSRPLSGSLSADASRPRTRTASAASALDTLSESGPAVDHFSVPLRDGLERLSAAEKGKNVMTPPRRRSEGFSLFGNSMGAGGARRVKMGGERDEGAKRGSLPDLAMRDDGEMGGTDSPRRLQAPMPHRVVPDLLTPTTLPPSAASTDAAVPFPSRRAASLDSLFLASVLQGPTSSPFNRPGTITTPNGHREPVHASVHNLRDLGGGRKRNANGALLVGQSVVAGSNLAAASPIVAESSSSPAPWNARDTFGEMDEDDDDEDAMEDDVEWGGNLSPPPPALTDGTTSASSSLSTSLSSHAEGDHVGVEGTSRSLSLQSFSAANKAETGPFFTPQNYKHVRPLQAAFMSTGLVSKRSRARNDSGVGLGLTPSFNFQQQLQQQLDDSLEAINPVEEPTLLASVSRTSIMPDTPVKKAAFAHPSTVASSPEILLNALHAPGSSSPNPKPSPSATCKSISPLHTGSSEGLGGLASPCSGRSPVRSPAESENGQQGGDVSPTVHASRSGSKGLMCSGSTKGGTWKRSAMFRRRSSGQLATEGGILGQFRSGSSSGSNTTSLAVEGEPMTPTRSVGRWGEGEFLLRWFS